MEPSGRLDRLQTASQADPAVCGFLDLPAAASGPISRGKRFMARRRDAKPNPPAVSRPTSSITGPIKPLPTPAAILNLHDVRDVRRARDAWDLITELYQIFNRWVDWFDEWEKTGKADPSLPARWRDEAVVCAKGLWVLGINSPFFLLDSQKAAELFEDEILPPVPNPYAAPDWSQDQEFRTLVRRRLESAESLTLRRELRIIMLTLQKKPMLAFCETGYDSGGSAGETAESTGPRFKRFSTQAASFEKGKGKTTGSNARQAAGSDEQEPKVLTLDNLTPTAWNLLRAMLKAKAKDPGTAKTREEIVAVAGTGNAKSKKDRPGNANSKNVRDAFRAMKELKLIGTEKNVGTWLTEAGLDALKSRR
jgi:hypothetical protein